jgi:hypothetical protein
VPIDLALASVVHRFPPDLLVTLSSNPGERFSVRRLNRLAGALHARRYLEIGVAQGETFLGIQAAERTGVDPRFAFDWQHWHGREGISLQQCRSDAFFASLDPATQFDLIFVDGLHTFEQTYRDLLHALRHSHPRTVIAIDDTVPCDVFSTCRDMEEALRLRREGGLVGDDRWHGDTYRVVPLLTAFHPDLQLLTLMDGGNPWTLLWRPPVPLAEDELRTSQAMQAIENLGAADYLWFLNHLSLYQPVAEAEGLLQVITALGGDGGEGVVAGVGEGAG